MGKGIGLVFGLLLLQVVSSLSTHHFFYRAASTGVLVRGGLITAIYTRSLRLTSRARSTLTNGKLVNHISTDVSRIDFCASWFHMVGPFPANSLCLSVLLTIHPGLGLAYPVDHMSHITSHQPWPIRSCWVCLIRRTRSHTDNSPKAHVRMASQKHGLDG